MTKRKRSTASSEDRSRSGPLCVENAYDDDDALRTRESARGFVTRVSAAGEAGRALPVRDFGRRKRIKDVSRISCRAVSDV